MPISQFWWHNCSEFSLDFKWFKFQHFCYFAFFLSRVSTLARDIDIEILSVCPSVRDVPGLDENGLTYCHSFLTVR